VAVSPHDEEIRRSFAMNRRSSLSSFPFRMMTVLSTASGARRSLVFCESFAPRDSSSVMMTTESGQPARCDSSAASRRALSAGALPS